MNKLTHREQKALAFIAAYIATEEVSPTCREVAWGVYGKKVNNPWSLGHYLINNLAKKGKVKKGKAEEWRSFILI